MAFLVQINADGTREIHKVPERKAFGWPDEIGWLEWEPVDIDPHDSFHIASQRLAVLCVQATNHTLDYHLAFEAPVPADEHDLIRELRICLHVIRDAAHLHNLEPEKANAWLALCQAYYLFGEAVRSRETGSWSHTEDPMKPFMEYGAEGGRTHDAVDRNAFKEEYRRERSNNSEATRQVIVDGLRKRYGHLAYTTLMKWAADADRVDRFTRRRGRPSKKK